MAPGDERPRPVAVEAAVQVRRREVDRQACDIERRHIHVVRRRRVHRHRGAPRARRCAAALRARVRQRGPGCRRRPIDPGRRGSFAVCMPLVAGMRQALRRMAGKHGPPHRLADGIWKTQPTRHGAMALCNRHFIPLPGAPMTLDRRSFNRNIAATLGLGLVGRAAHADSAKGADARRAAGRPSSRAPTAPPATR